MRGCVKQATNEFARVNDDLLIGDRDITAQLFGAPAAIHAEMASAFSQHIV